MSELLTNSKGNMEKYIKVMLLLTYMAAKKYQYLQNWQFKAYSKLYRKKRLVEFSYEEARRILGRGPDEKERLILSRMLTDLKQRGWLTAKQDPSNKRKKLYRLNPPDKTFLKVIGYSN